MTVTRPYRPQIAQNYTKIPAEQPSSLVQNHTYTKQTLRPVSHRPTFVTKPQGGHSIKPSGSNNNVYIINTNSNGGGDIVGPQQGRPLATSPSNKISSSPNLSGGPQRGTARPIAANTINDMEPQASVSGNKHLLFIVCD